MRHEVAQEMRVGPSESAGVEISRTNLFLEITMGMEKPMSQYIVAVMEVGISFPHRPRVLPMAWVGVAAAGHFTILKYIWPTPEKSFCFMYLFSHNYLAYNGKDVPSSTKAPSNISYSRIIE